MSARAVYARWVLRTSGGWVLGVALVVVAAVALDAIGVGGSQLPVGLGMGLGVALAQSGVVAEIVGGKRRWVGATVLAAAVPFALSDGLSALGLPTLYSLPAAALAAGLLVGASQARLLPAEEARGWVLRSAAGWLLAGLVAAASQLLPKGLVGWPALVVVLALFFGGGPVLGASGAGPVARMSGSAQRIEPTSGVG